MAYKRRKSQEDDVPVVCRRPTTDLKDVQDILKSVVETSEGFISRHTSINEEESMEEILHEQLFDSPPLILKDNEQSVHQPSNDPSLGVPSASNDTDGDSKFSGQRYRQSPLYGELIVVGSNGSLPCAPLSPKMTHRYILRKQPKASGVSLIVRNPKDINSLSRVSTHTVAMTMAKSKMCVMEFGPDQSMDMFQIGRSTDSAIDIVVVDTITTEDGKKKFNSNSAISRYSCRILCEREPPYTARIFAAAFDINRKIQLSPMAPSWIDSITGDTDGLTTNGISVLRPVGVFESGVEPAGKWYEITVMGNIREMRSYRSCREPGEPIPEESNVLTDGCLIDLCGITLMWRTALGLDHGPSDTLLRDRQYALNIMTPQCPVNFMTLHFKSGQLITTTTSPDELNDDDDIRDPWVYINCGHVFGHIWKSTTSTEHRICPLCSKVGPYIKLELGQEKAFFVDEGSLTHAFVPCGHVTTEETAKYWSKVHLPHFSKSFCPFCSTTLNSDRSYIKLYFS